MTTHSEISRHRVVSAKDIVEELTQGSKGLKRFLPSTKKPLLPLRNKAIRGKLDLRNLVIDKPLEIRECDFEDGVDLRYCEFKQVVNFSGCNFRQRFNSGDEVESHTIYRKDLICKGATFAGTVSLNGARVEGSAYFSGASFLNVEQSADFTASSFGKTLDCNNAVFKGPVSFNMLQCGNNAYFHSARFEGGGEADFAFASFGTHIECPDTLFEGKANFHRVKCGDSAYFERAHFEGSEGTNFAFASFGANLYCDEVAFLGSVNFDSLVCADTGYFRGADFQSEEQVTFHYASFGHNLLCNGAKYRGEVSFRSVKCGHNAVFTNAGFVGEVNLRYLELGRNLDLRWTYWTKRARLGQIQVSKKLRLGGACFRGAVELYDSSIGTFELWDPNHPDDQPLKIRTTFPQYGENDLRSVIPSENELEDTSQKTDAWSARQELHNRLNRGGQEAKDLVDDLFPFEMQDEKHLTGMNVTSTSFERFHGGPTDELARRLAVKLADSQDPMTFSIDPYRSLSNHYASIGDEAEAKEMRVRGYHGLRENRRKGGRTNWTRKRWISEWLLYRPTKYGYRIWPLLLPPIFFLFIVGTAVFWSQGSLEPVAGTKYPPPYDAPLAQKMFEHAVYSLDLLVPALNLRYEAMWVPKSGWLLGWIYATFHSILGWILIALFISWLTGVIKPPE